MPRHVHCRRHSPACASPNKFGCSTIRRWACWYALPRSGFCLRDPIRPYRLRLMSDRPQPRPILLGNTFPLGLVRRPVLIQPSTLSDLRQTVQEHGFVSFWGHNNTAQIASELVGFNVRSHLDRPALTLNHDRHPVLEHHTFTECWVISPDYKSGWRPSPGAEIPPEQIVGWQILRLTWLD